MYYLYNITIIIVGFFLNIIALFNKKIKLFIKGRKEVFKTLAQQISSTDRVIWFHAASLGEFEQGRPIIESVKSQYPNHKILVTFFSPSGYEIRKDFQLADVVSYLPLDTKQNVKKFLKLTHPELAIFIKYEFWPNLLKGLGDQQVKTILVSGIFRKEQSFFNWYGNWMRKSLKAFHHFFVQNTTSKILLNSIGFQNVTISGDTRFDRVFDITKQEISFEAVEKFKNNKTTLIAGSTWPKDEALIVDYINKQSNINQKFIIAPHNINQSVINDLLKRIKQEVLLFSKIDKYNPSNFQVLIIDSIGLLSKIYYYADIAYVGGGFGTGIHNILEPATFGIPIIIGPNYKKFNEAIALVDLKACVVIQNNLELKSILYELFENKEIRLRKGGDSKQYIIKQKGATEIIVKYVQTLIKK